VADAALLDAKATGRDRIVVAEGSGVTDLERALLQSRPAG